MKHLFFFFSLFFGRFPVGCKDLANTLQTACRKKMEHTWSLRLSTCSFTNTPVGQKTENITKGGGGEKSEGNWYLEDILNLLCFTHCHVLLAEMALANVAEVKHDLHVFFVGPFLPLSCASLSCLFLVCLRYVSLFLAAESENPGLDSVPISKIGRLDVQSRKQVVEYRFSSAHPRVCISPPQKSFEKSS